MSEVPMLCPRRSESPPYPGLPETDEWRDDGTCSYCGSLKPDEFMRRAESGIELGPTDKNYKVYTEGGPRMGKFYFQHLSHEQQARFVELLNARTLNVGYPGRFYVLPFFVNRTS